MALGQTLAGLAPIAGAGIGSFFGPVGTAIGGGIGSIAGNLASDYFKQQSPAEQARAQLLQQLQGPSPFQRVSFDPLAAEESRRFQQQTIPGIANQFAGLGGLSSSGFRQALSGAGQDFQTRLAALRSQHELQQQGLQTGSEERRRQMLGNLSGGLIGEENAQNMGRQNQLMGLLSGIPGTMLQAEQNQNQRGQVQLSDILKGLLQQQSAQEGAVHSGTQASQPIFGKAFDNFIQQNPTGAQQFLKYYFEALSHGSQLAGQLGAAALAA